jgi:hypothetical protein
MTINALTSRLLLGGLLAFGLVGCNGSSSSTQPETDEPTDEPSTIEISGKAADGYLIGATACLDLNGNKQCDADEPSAETGAGGVFTLDVPEGIDVDAYAIVVEVHDSTIDEDTGTAVGKPFVLSAPPGMTDFISPLTTAVHAVLERNPALTAEEAAELVKEQIGAGESVSLFEDYVAAKNDLEDAAAADYERLHKVAQVSGKVLAENYEAIMDAAAAQNIDVAESFEQLLALVVAQVLEQLAQSAQAVDDAGDSFDIDTVVVGTADTTDLEQQIDASPADSTLIGSWHYSFEPSWGGIVLTFLPNGEYMHAEVRQDEADGYSGIERGTYTWNPITGDLTVPTIITDTNGDWGLSDLHEAGETLKVLVKGNSMMIEDMTFTRVQQATGSIVGSWAWRVEDELGIVTFLPDGTYFLAEDGNGDAYGYRGVEHGRYSWDASSSELAVTEILYDTNGNWGLSDLYLSGETLKVSIEGRTLTVPDEDEELVLGEVCATCEIPGSEQVSSPGCSTCDIPSSFSMEWLSGRTLYAVWWGLGEDENGAQVDDLPVVVKSTFSADGSAQYEGLLNSSSGEGYYAVDENGGLYFGNTVEELDGTTARTTIVCGSTSQYIKTHYTENGVFDNVDLYFFDEAEALAFASTLSGSIAPCTTSVITAPVAHLMAGTWWTVEHDDGVRQDGTVDFYCEEVPSLNKISIADDGGWTYSFWDAEAGHTVLTYPANAVTIDDETKTAILLDEDGRGRIVLTYDTAAIAIHGQWQKLADDDITWWENYETWTSTPPSVSRMMKGTWWSVQHDDGLRPDGTYDDHAEEADGFESIAVQENGTWTYSFDDPVDGPTTLIYPPAAVTVDESNYRVILLDEDGQGRIVLTYDETINGIRGQWQKLATDGSTWWANYETWTSTRPPRVCEQE